MKIRLAIAIPNTGTIKAQMVFCLCRALKDFPYEYTVLFKEGSVLHTMREDLVKKAIELKYTHLLFLDSDMYFEKDAIHKLIKRNKDIIGVDYQTRKHPSESTVVNPKGKGLTTCESVATGFMLIKLNVFKKLPHPWFFWESDDKGNLLTGEDYWFCRLARQAGFKIWCDLTLNVKHIGEFLY